MAQLGKTGERYGSCMKTLNSIVLALAMATGAAWHVPAAGQPVPAATQSSVARGVTLKITPKGFSGPEWTFAVVLDTHSEDLKDDLLQTAVLVIDGREIRPIEWQGPGAGGHHREGILRFPAAGEKPDAVELRVQRAGEAVPRVFRWEGTALN